ncbi:response regulator [Ectothiorhodospiraceae bacterium BW-2]|nr:response regulator [Ectothiorhodospiraceae bacterium BW-2]
MSCDGEEGDNKGTAVRRSGSRSDYLASTLQRVSYLQHAFEQHAIVSIADVAGNIVYANEKFCQISGYRREELMGQNHRIVKSDEHPPEFFQQLWTTIVNGEIWHGEIKNRAKDGSPYWVNATIVPILDDNGRPEQYIAVRTDVTENKLNEQHLQRQQMQIATINQAQSMFIYNPNPEIIFNALLPDMLQLTSSRFGLIAELFNDGLEGEQLLVYAVNDEQESPQRLPLSGLLQQVVAESGECAIIDNHLSIDEQAALPDCFPPLTNFLGLPIKSGGKRVGAIVLGNHPEGYDEESLTPIEPLINTCGYLFFALKRERERVAKEVELDRAKQAAEAANVAKSQFLATMSHELRTPLTTILGFSESLQQTPLTEQQREMLHNVYISGTSLLSLINDILDLSKIESGNFTIDLNPFNLQQLLKDVIAIFTVRAQQEQTQLRLQSDANHPAASWQLVSDGNRLRQVLINLVGNALKFSKGNEVTLSLRYSEIVDNRVEVAFKVIDTGIGMSPEVMARLFRPFEQADNSISRRFGGTGLGLYISQQLVKLMGGYIEVNSVVGEGSCFQFVLPMELYEPVVERSQGRMDELIPPRLQGRVLIVDDTPEIRLLLGGILTSIGVEFDSAEEGEQGFGKAMSGSYDMILMDMQMPVMDGIETTTMLRQLGNDTPIYALTANVMQSQRQQFLAAGCDGFLSKPIERRALFAALSEHLQPREQEGGESQSRRDEGGDDAAAAMLAEAGALFLNSLEDKLSAIKAAISANRWEEADKQVHTIKGGGGTFGYPRLTALARELEQQLRRERVSVKGVSSALAALCREGEAILAARCARVDPET